MRKVAAGFAALLFAAAGAGGVDAPARADSPDPSGLVFDRVEEDWVLVVDDTVTTSDPQINTVMGPSLDLSSPVAVLDLNYRHVPSFTAGGMQAVVYGADGIVSSRTIATFPLNVPNETVRWTQQMRSSGSTVEYLITKLDSTTWGSYVSDVVLVSFDAPATGLAAYSPDASAKFSGSAWKTDGVKSLTLVQVRYYLAGVVVATDTASRPVDFSKPFSRP